MGADVKIAILDSCSSGAFTRLKGGSRQAPFLIDESSNTQGHAFITSSSETEAAQESDSIGASFFTHYLVSGLRGAADSNGNGRVTLNEVYTYAHSETLARTSTTLAGPQHAAHDINLAGSGDLVLTDLRSATAGIVFEESVAGQMFVTDENGRLVVEIRKEAGTALTVALPPGKYRLTLDAGDELLERDVDLGRDMAWIRSESFVALVPEVAGTRGDSESLERPSDSSRADAIRVDAEALAERIRTDVATRLEERLSTIQDLVHLDSLIDLIPAFDTESERLVVHDLSLKIVGRSYRIEGLDIGLMNFVTEDVKGAQIGGVAGIVGDDVYGAQVSGVFNILGGRVFGAQAAGVFNIAGGPIYGAQAAGVFNIGGADVRSAQAAGVFNIASGDVSGAQVAGAFNIASGEVQGAQASALFNIGDGDLSGAQAAGLFNIADGVQGVQAEGLFNISDGNARGIQAAGLFNISDGGVRGIQAAGLFNAAEDVRGVQIGLVNVGGDVSGSQIGLVNISRHISGLPIGLINISGNGLFNPSVWADDSGFIYAGLQLGAGALYTIVFAGTPRDFSWTQAGLGLGLGIHLSFGNWHIDTDLSLKSFGSGETLGSAVTESALAFSEFVQIGEQGWFSSRIDDLPIYPSARIHAGFRLFGSVTLLAGVTLESLLAAGQSKNDYFHVGETWDLHISEQDYTISVYPRWFFGLRV